MTTTETENTKIAEGLRSESFAAFLAGKGEQALYPVAVLGERIAGEFDAASKTVYLSSETAAKQRKHHPELAAEDYQEIQDILDNGEYVKQGAAKLAFTHHSHRWFTAILKKTIDNKETYLVSFFRSNPRTVRQIKKRGRP